MGRLQSRRSRRAARKHRKQPRSGRRSAQHDASNLRRSTRLARKHGIDLEPSFQLGTEKSLGYRPLELNRRQIRILRLLPGNLNDPICCELYTAYLDDKPYYEALSYAWGDPTVCLPILVDGKIRQVTVNLAAALRRLRRRLYSRHMWVDALCIDQSDNAEKSHQVDLMKEIYSKTDHAHLWLGDYSDAGPIQWPSQVSVDDSKLYSNNPSSVMSRETAHRVFRYIKLVASGGHLTKFSDVYISQVGSRPADDLETLMKLPWWTRIWTAQESVFPKRAIFRYGTARLSRHIFLAAARNMIDHFSCCSKVKISNTFVQETTNLVYGLRVTSSPGGALPHQSFLPTLWTWGNRVASDPRDYVLALLGFGLPIEADYSNPASDIFARLTRAYIKKFGDLQILLVRDKVERELELPSWVPDYSAYRWTIGQASDTLFWLMYHNYNGAAGKEVETRCPKSERELDLRGFKLGHIAKVGNIMKKITRLDVAREWRNLMEASCGSSYITYPLGGSYDEAFYRVLQTGLHRERRGLKRNKLTRGNIELLEKVREKWAPGSQGTSYCVSKRFFITDKGWIGVGGPKIKVGDAAYIFLGGRMPFILRPRHSTPEAAYRYAYISPAYIDGIMEGEMMNDTRPLKWVTLE